jgi:uncharacterized membrane protein
MKRPIWHWLIATGVVAVAALLAFALIKAGYACANPNKRAAFKIVEANGCIEFWFNRYQTTIAAFVSIVVAIYVIRPALRQLAEMRKQSSSDARQVLREIIADMSEEVTACRSLNASMIMFNAIGYSFAQHEKADGDPSPEAETLQEIIASVGENLSKLQEFLGGDPDNATLEEWREILLDKAYVARTTASQLAGLSMSLFSIGKSKADLYKELSEAAHIAADHARGIAGIQEEAISAARSKLRKFENIITEAR